MDNGYCLSHLGILGPVLELCIAFDISWHGKDRILQHSEKYISLLPSPTVIISASAFTVSNHNTSCYVLPNEIQTKKSQK